MSILTCLETFAMFEEIKKQRVAAIVMYHLTQYEEADPEFKSQLLSSSQLEMLRFNPYFSVVYSADLLDCDDIPTDSDAYIFSQSDLQVFGFPLQQIVAPKELIREYVLVD